MDEWLKRYIENNIDYIQNGEWDKVFKGSEPGNIGGILYEVGIDFLHDITHVPDRSFHYNESLTSISIPSNITSIGYGAFSKCVNLKDIHLSYSIERIEGYAFSGCVSLSDLILPLKLSYIGENAFWRCSNLKHITIPKSVTTIESKAFSECSHIDITYQGTIQEWKQLLGDNSDIFYKSTYICTCTDGVIKKSR